MADTPTSPKPGSKDSWGPKLWKILHNLAWLSDRTDVIFIWRKLMKSLTDVMPCPVCRAHLIEHMKHHSMFGRQHIYTSNGPQIKEHIVNTLWILHNLINKRNMKDEFPRIALDALYEGKTRSEIISETNRVIRDMNAEWEPIVRQQITGMAFREWRSDTSLIIGLVSGGPN
jgi:Erv1 / Alr family